MKLPIADPIPAWYELGVKDGNTLVIRVHKTAFAHICAIDWGKAPIIAMFKEEHGLPDFILPSEPSWGFGKVIVCGKSNDPNWIVWECKLPVLKQKKSHEDERGNVYAVRSTLAVLFLALSLFEGETSCGHMQLIVVDGLRVVADMHGGSLSATLTPTMIQWIAKQPDHSRLSEVEKVMKQADAYMWPDTRSEDRYENSWYFKVLCRQPKWINMDVPGDACGLDPDDYGDSDNLDRGYSLCPHNIDSSLQQLTFLMGLAKLHELARNSS